MDPTATLVEIRDLCTQNDTDGLDPIDTDRLVELVQALDEWITKGGFLPSQWTSKRP